MKLRFSLLCCLNLVTIMFVFGQDKLESATAQFKEGNFAESAKICNEILAKDKQNFPAILLKGRIALLANKLKDAEKLLNQAIKAKPDEKDAKSLLAEVFYRRNEFQKSAKLLRETGREIPAQKLESFGANQPYLIESKSVVTTIRFEKTDPLPLLKVRINDSEEVNFLIDTGAAEVIIDTEFAKKIKAQNFGAETGTFGGGKRASFEHGRVDSITLGDFKVKNLPVHILNTQRFSPIFGGAKIDGIIGTSLFYRFLATLDYPKGELVLRLKNSKIKDSEKQAAIPFWMSGTHFLVAEGKVNSSKPSLFFIDTGLAGQGFTAPKSTIDEAKINISQQNVAQGVGGGGTVSVVPFVADEVCLGSVCEKQIGGVFGAFPQTLEMSQGFRIGGLLSHTFFRKSAVTFDFEKMVILLNKPA